MALIKCSECGNEISDKAEMCPNCGAKNQAKISYNKREYVTEKNEYTGYGTGVKCWLGLCTILNAMTVLANLSQSMLLLALLSFIGTICYGILWLQENEYGFYGVCIVAVICLVINFNIIGGLAILGLLNPLITFLVIKKYFF